MEGRLDSRYAAGQAHAMALNQNGRFDCKWYSLLQTRTEGGPQELVPKEGASQNIEGVLLPGTEFKGKGSCGRGALRFFFIPNMPNFSARLSSRLFVPV